MIGFLLPLPGSYDCRDSSATTLFMIGTTLGEAVMPAVFGYCMKYVGPDSLSWLVTVCCLLLIAVYVSVDILGKKSADHFMEPLPQTINDMSSSRNLEVNLANNSQLGLSGMGDASLLPGCNTNNSHEDAELVDV